MVASNPKNPELKKHIKDLKDYVEAGLKDFNLKREIQKEEKLKVKPNPADLDNFKRSLDYLGYELSFNIEKNLIQIKGFNKNPAWQNMDDHIMSYIYLAFKEKVDKLRKETFTEWFKGHIVNNQHEPFKEWLEKLKWDGKPRLENILTTLFKTRKDRKDIAEWAMESLLLAVVKRTYEPGTKHDETLVLRGSQGIGKSLMLSNLVPDKEFFTDSFSFSMNYKEKVEQTMGKMLVEAGEGVGVRKADQNSVKNYLTMTSDRVRLAYGRFTTERPRRFVIVMTTNDLQPLPDDLTGLRRFVVVELKKKLDDKEIVSWVIHHRTQLWAEAVKLYKEGKSARLPERLWAKVAEVNEEHRGGHTIFEEKFLEKVYDVKYYKKPYLTISVSDILLEMLNETEEIDETDPLLAQKRYKKGVISSISAKHGPICAELLRKEGFKKAQKRVEGSNPKNIWTKKWTPAPEKPVIKGPTIVKSDEGSTDPEGFTKVSKKWNEEVWSQPREEEKNNS